jgi:hypothetical protein
MRMYQALPDAHFKIGSAIPTYVDLQLGFLKFSIVFESSGLKSALVFGIWN